MHPPAPFRCNNSFEAIINTPETIPSATVQNLSQYLNEISIKKPSLQLSSLPKLVSKCATVFMEFKQMKIDNDQFYEKCRILDACLQGQISNQKMELEFNNAQEIQKINTYKTIELEKNNTKRAIELAKINAAKELKSIQIDAYMKTELARINTESEIIIVDIEANTQRALAEIESNERVQIKAIQANYDIKRKEQEDALYKFQENLREDSRRFDKKFNEAKREQIDRHICITELQKTIKYINIKIKRSKATTIEMEYCKYLWELQVQMFKDGCSFTQSLCTVCSGGM